MFNLVNRIFKNIQKIAVCITRIAVDVTAHFNTDIKIMPKVETKK